MLRFGIKWLKRMTPLHLNTNEFLIAAKKCWCLLIAPIWLLSHADRRHSDQDGWEWFNFRKRRGRPVHYYRFKLAVNWSILERFRCFLSETNVQNECYKWSEPHLNTFSSSKAINIKFSFCHSFNKTKTKKRTKKPKERPNASVYICGVIMVAVSLIVRTKMLVFCVHGLRLMTFRIHDVCIGQCHDVNAFFWH